MKMEQILTSERDRSFGKVRVFCFPQAEQSWGEKWIIDKVLHIVTLAFFFGFSAHLICNILPAVEENISN